MMVDINIKKVIIPFTDLPAIYGTNFTYNIRYRIVSEDRNRYSHWSRIYTIDASTNNNGNPIINPYSYNYVKETVTTDSGTTTGIRLGWQLIPGATVPTTFTSYDIFVKRDASNWEFIDNTSAQTYTVLRTGTETLITIALQAPTYPKERNTSAELFVTSAITVP